MIVDKATKRGKFRQNGNFLPNETANVDKITLKTLRPG